MRTLLQFAGAVTLALTVASELSAQTKMPGMGGMGGMGRGKAAMNMPTYDPKSIATVSGVLTAIDTVASMGMGVGPGVHLTMRAGKQTWPVHVGPVPFLVKQTLRLKVGDSVTVKGSKVIVSTVPTLVAAQITRGKESLDLRDAAGLPLWRGTMMPKRP